MPTAPAVLGAIAEALLGRTGRVEGVTEPFPGFLDVRLRADPPPGGWHPTHELQFRVTPTRSRRYNIRTVDPDHADRIGLLVATRANGPGTTWAKNLRAGAETTILAGRHIPLRLPGTRRLHLGDSSALGTIDAHTHDRTGHLVAVEVPPAAVAALAQRWPHHHFVPAGPLPGDAMEHWLERAIDAGTLDGIDGALLLGHAQSLQRHRTHLLRRQVLTRRAIVTKPYWATGKEGL
ncbi:hypothetical protein [Verrucosispora sp. NA02020]|uniref:hypothetical protein n=1 Tax=Verrucosispora sp. NA02020 TaxID=2742132 RepID=UPI0015916A51|nr:hypothetical protein [Verrucosispora sp. NA02020]QKW11917.1 hypothetical protein HUT12_03350 [Verrucosispora sp. NA02020]